MNCLTCSHDTVVIDTRMTSKGLRRRRQCILCGDRFSTIETPVTYTRRKKAPQDVWKMEVVPVVHKVLKKEKKSELLERLEARGLL